jgi:hypothetical protein
MITCVHIYDRLSSVSLDTLPRFTDQMVRLGLLDRRHRDSNISINNDPLHANEGSTDSSRRQLQFGTMYDIFFYEVLGVY